MVDFRKIYRQTYLEREDGFKVYFDAVMKRTENNSAKVTRHSVESGFKISDNRAIENLKLSLDCVISDANNSILNKFVNVTSDSASAKRYLKEIFNDRKLVSIVTHDESFDSLVITSLDFNKDSPTRGELKFSLRLEEIRVVSSRTALVPAASVDKSVKNAIQGENQDSKAKTSEAETDGKGEKNGSFFRKLTSRWGGKVSDYLSDLNGLDVKIKEDILITPIEGDFSDIPTL